MSTVKEEAINLITRLPDEAGWDDIMYEMYVKKKIELGIKAADEGRVIPHEEVKRIFSRVDTGSERESWKTHPS